MSNTIVNTNMAALNSHRQIVSVGVRQARSAERLSSGMRINRAADDAAGLAISEKMRNQIRGLDQATRNSQDGISVVQTAEGAMEEIHRMLERTRELINQSANDTYTQQDRENILLEVNQLMQEVDQTVNNTEFNTLNLLGGSPLSTPSNDALVTLVSATISAADALGSAQADLNSAQMAHDAAIATLVGAEATLNELMQHAIFLVNDTSNPAPAGVDRINQELRDAIAVARDAVATAQEAVGAAAFSAAQTIMASTDIINGMGNGSITNLHGANNHFHADRM